VPDETLSVKNEKQYEALKDKGMSKERAARIANSPRESKRGGKKSHSKSSSAARSRRDDRSEEGRRAQGREATARSR
jgi:hypothetical protein